MIKIHGDWMSQPSRAVLCFCLMAGVPHIFVSHLIHKGDLKKPEFLALNPLGTVPIIEDGEFKLAESHAILTYIHRTRNCADHWYPSAPQARAHVDHYLHWHHTGLRTLAQVVYHRFEAEKLGRPANIHLLQAAEAQASKALQTLDTWLGTKRFIAGEEASIADVSAACEIAQGKLIGYDLARYRNVGEWFQRVYGMDGMVKGHAMLEKIVARQKSRETTANTTRKGP